ncbi:MAG: nuclear transport factor 2 family protein, partial [Halobacteriales archaeon]|nr:nuclear transport factor 2 family protein [Halobacteriales archaeon]
MADRDTIKRLYAALADKDGEAMAALYADDARFSDPVFPDLKGPEVGAMWRLLCERAQDLRVEVRNVKAKGGLGEAEWEAWYT